MAVIYRAKNHIFKTPTTITISGCTGCGKTTLVKRMLSCPELFSTPPDRIIYCYGVWQKSFRSFPENVEFRKGLDIADLNEEQHTLMVFDDLMREITKSKDAEWIFTGGSHHQNITPIVLLQNLYPRGTYSRDININTHYVILMHNTRDRGQVRHLATRSGLNERLVDAYNDCMKTRYAYLVVDFSPHATAISILTNIFPGEHMIFYC